jgi:hypothetical protein
VKVADPLRRLPRRSPHSVRRTESLWVRPIRSWDGELRLRGVALDAVVDAHGRVAAERPVRAEITVDGDTRIVELTADPAVPALDELLGQHAIVGFRSALAGVDELDRSAPLAALLDDVPMVRLIAGYAVLMTMPGYGGGSRGPGLNICRGWAEGDTAHRLALAGEPIVNTTTTTPAPALAAMLADQGDFHAEAAPGRDAMCRRRLLEVRATDAGYTAAGYTVYEYFRDTYVDAAGAENSLHEYVVRARIGADWTVEDLDVEPRALPFPECQLAAPKATDLRGVALPEIHPQVRRRLSGTTGCTHLSDTLRYLRFVEPLARQLTPSRNP